MHLGANTGRSSEQDWPPTWQQATLELGALSEAHPNKDEFISQVLRHLREVLDCVRVTFLQCAPDAYDDDVQMVTGQTFPRNKIIEPLNSTEVSIFENITTFPSDRSSRYVRSEITKNGTTYIGCALQMRMSERGYVYALYLTFRGASSFPPETLSADDPAMRFFSQVLHVKHSRQHDLARKQRKERRQLIDRIMSKSGDMSELAREVCEAWRELLDSPALRLWILNRETRELKILHVSCIDEYKEFLARGHNRLREGSRAMQAVLDRKVVRSRYPTEADDPPDEKTLAILERHGGEVIRIPVISADLLERGSTEPRLLGLICAFIKDDGRLFQPDDRLLFISSITAAALLRARSLEGREVTERVNNAALKLVNPDERWHLSKRKDAFLDEVIAIIKEALNVNCCSIFEADDSRESLKCVATTGIDGHPYFKNTVIYRKDGGRTWTVFQTGESMTLPNLAETDSASGEVFREARSLDPDDGLDPFLALPLPGQNATSATGVIRLCERKCEYYDGQLQAFSSHDKKLLEQIAADVSPILQMIKMQAHREVFVERTSHQLIQPLQGVLGYVENTIDGIYRDEEQRNEKLCYVRQMVRAAVGMIRSGAWLAESMDFASVGKAPRSEAKVTKYFLERVIDMQPLRKVHDKVLIALVNTDHLDTLGYFLADAIFFDQAFQNVLYNAVKYSYRNTTITVTVNRVKKELWVFIASTGLPIPENEDSRIFLDLERGETATMYDPIGTGQGLYITRKIMRGLGGDIELFSCEPVEDVQAPEGWPQPHRTTFKLWYPGAFR